MEAVRGPEAQRNARSRKLNVRGSPCATGQQIRIAQTRGAREGTFMTGGLVRAKETRTARRECAGGSEVCGSGKEEQAGTETLSRIRLAGDAVARRGDRRRKRTLNTTAPNNQVQTSLFAQARVGGVLEKGRRNERGASRNELRKPGTARSSRFCSQSRDRREPNTSTPGSSTNKGGERGARIEEDDANRSVGKMDARKIRVSVRGSYLS